jgi:hypothetical protein
MTRSKATTSPKKKDNAQKNIIKKNSPDGRDQKTIGGLKTEGGGNSFPPTQPAATAAPPQPPADTLLKDPASPIAKQEDPHNTKNETVPISQVTALTTPKADAEQQPEEQPQHTGEVTFHQQSAAASVGNSRRQRSRIAKSSGRTSKALSRDEQRMFLWEEEQYQRLFHSSKSGADPVAKIVAGALRPASR